MNTDGDHLGLDDAFFWAGVCLLGLVPAAWVAFAPSRRPRAARVGVFKGRATGGGMSTDRYFVGVDAGERVAPVGAHKQLGLGVPRHPHMVMGSDAAARTASRFRITLRSGGVLLVEGPGVPLARAQCVEVAAELRELARVFERAGEEA